jgi:AraC-like DNA-binding protein
LKQRADRLLKSGPLSHAEIADRLGFTDPTSFSRSSRRWFGADRRGGDAMSSPQSIEHR